MQRKMPQPMDRRVSSGNFTSADAKISVRISTSRERFHLGDQVLVHIEIRNVSNENLFISKDIESRFSNALAVIRLALYHGNDVVGPTKAAAADSFASERTTYPPLARELSRYWIALPPGHFYGGEVVMDSSWYERLLVPGKYSIRGTYSSRGFLAQDVNNPLLHYADELQELPYRAWEGQVQTNTLPIEITK
jgi:hypothetical protein